MSTFTDYRNYVSQMRYRFSNFAQNYIRKTRTSLKLSSYDEYILKMVGMYIDVLESYFYISKVVGSTSTGNDYITLYKSVTPSTYDMYVGHIVTGTGIPVNTRVTKIVADKIYLSKSVTAVSTNAIYIIGRNCISEAKFLCIVDHLNRIFNTNYCIEPYFTEFDLTLPTVTTPVGGTSVLLYGSNASVLNGANIYAALTAEEDWSAANTKITYNFSLEYLYFAYPATNPDLIEILDQEGDDVLESGAVAQELITITSGLSEDTQYKVYRSQWITSISSKEYTFKFS